MESLKALDEYDTTSKIRQYLERSEPIVDCERPAELSIPARLCYESLKLFQETLRLIFKTNGRPLPRSEHISLERSFSQFKLWSDGYGVSNEELDAVLERSKMMRRDILKLLRSIGITLVDRLVPWLFGKSSMSESLRPLSIEVRSIIEVCQDNDDEFTSSGSSTDSLEDNIQEMAEDLQTDTLCLMEIGDLLKDPVLDSIKETEKSAPYAALMHWEPHQAFCDKVETRFPKATEVLVLRLGKANYERYIRCQQERETREQATMAADSIEQPVRHALDGSIFHDSGLGSSMPSATSYAETLMSYGSTSGRSVRVPAIPSEGKAGKPFACLICGRSVNITNNSAWKRHLYSDLRPWLCLDISCSFGDTSFKDMNDWVSHLSLDHRLEPLWESFRCPLCHVETGNGKATITRHLGDHLEEISLGVLLINVDYESDSESAKESSSDRISPREGCTKDTEFSELEDLSKGFGGSINEESKFNNPQYERTFRWIESALLSELRGNENDPDVGPSPVAPPVPPPVPSRFPCWCRAIWSWEGHSQQYLSFIEGDLIECLNAGDGSWWTGRLRRNETIGLFPSNFFEILPQSFRPVSSSTSPLISGNTPSPTTGTIQQTESKLMAKTNYSPCTSQPIESERLLDENDPNPDVRESSATDLFRGPGVGAVRRGYGDNDLKPSLSGVAFERKSRP